MKNNPKTIKFDLKPILGHPTLFFPLFFLKNVSKASGYLATGRFQRSVRFSQRKKLVEIDSKGRVNEKNKRGYNSH
jgi:hypothetical protein